MTDEGTVTDDAMEFLRGCIIARLNIIISGYHSGKTRFVNMLSNFIPDGERIITVERRAELQLGQELVMSLECPPPSVSSQDIISMADLVGQALRMMPDRLIVEDLDGSAALDLTHAMSAGFDGMLVTMRGHSPQEILVSLETASLMGGWVGAVTAFRDQIASGVHLIIQLDRLGDGLSKVTRVTEVQGIENDAIAVNDIFAFEQDVGENGQIIGSLKPTGLRPKNSDQIFDAGIKLSPHIFGNARR